MIYPRVHDWRIFLNAHINLHKPVAFEWGTHDCCTWVTGCIDLIYEFKRFDGLKGSYTGPMGAKSTLKKRFASATVQDACASLFGEIKPKTFARVGDAVIGDEKLIDPRVARLFGPPVGICNGARSYFVSDGLFEIDTLKTVGCYHTHEVADG